MPIPKRVPFVALVTGIALTLSACATGPSVPAVPTFDVVLDDPGDAGVFAVGLLMISPAGLSSLSTEALPAPSSASPELATSELVEVETGVFFGDLVEITDGGTAEASLPAASEIPAATIVPVGQAFLNATEAPDCAVDAEPATADVTTVVFEFLTIPGFVATAFDGAAVALATEAPIDVLTFPEDGDRVLGWAYAEEAVELSFTGGDCGPVVVEDVALGQGWNTLAWTYDLVDDTFTLSVIDGPDTVYLTVGP